jgi:hypothetical protein
MPTVETTGVSGDTDESVAVKDDSELAQDMHAPEITAPADADVIMESPMKEEVA